MLWFKNSVTMVGLIVKNHCAISKFLAVSCVIVLVGGCSVIDEPLMPTPVLYEVLQATPLEGIPVEEQWNSISRGK